jgi:hypothetical protein
MAVSSMLSDAKAVVSTTVNVSEPITNTHHLPPTAHHPRAPHAPTRITQRRGDVGTTSTTPRRALASFTRKQGISDDLRRGEACAGSSYLIRLMRNHAVVSQDMAILRVVTSAACPPGGTVRGCLIASGCPPSLSASASTANARCPVSFSSNCGQASPLLTCNASRLYI